MVAHLDVPCLESRDGHPSSLSKSIISDLLVKELNFKGLVFTDALNMKAVSQFAEEGEVELEAFLSGSDVLLMPLNPIASNERLLKAVEAGTISMKRLELSVKKILMAKYKVGLHQYVPVEEEQMIADLNGLENDILYETCMEEALTVAKNNFGLLPIKKLENKRIAYVEFGDSSGEAFYKMLANYAKVTWVKE